MPLRILIALAPFALCMSTAAAAGARVDLIQKRGFVDCGIEEDVPRFRRCFGIGGDSIAASATG